MSYVFLIPGFISLFWVVRGRVQTAFLSVYLPTLILLPHGYAARIPHMPPLSAAEAALIPIMAVAFWRFVRNGIPSLLDVLMLLHVASVMVSETLREPIAKDGALWGIEMLLSQFGAYLVGKTMIEKPGIRLQTVRRIVWLMVILAPIGLAEWRLGQNFYGVFSERFLGVSTVQTSIQIRGGWGRFNAAFSDAEIAGIAIAMTCMLAAWLFYIRRWNVLPAAKSLLERAESWHGVELILLGCLLLTQSRGPILAVVIGYVLAQIPRFRKTRPACIAMGILVIAIVAGILTYLHQYTTITDPSQMNDERVTSALYRSKMNNIYKDMANDGGLLGWGILHHPVLEGMASVDNEFLLERLGYGSLGYWTFLLVVYESVRRIFFVAWQRGAREDVAFAYILAAALLLAWLALTTVYMGEQLPQYVFLLAGWGQAIGKHPMLDGNPVETLAPRRFAFARIFQ